MRTRRVGLIWVLALVAALATGGSEQAAAKTTIKDEIEIGKKAAKDIEKEFPLSDHKDWQEEIDRLGKSLTPYVKRKDIPYSFKIIREKVKGRNEVDAFSLPGGPIYFSERLWQLLTRDERLGVLAHEIAHVDKRHAIDTMSEMQRRGMWAVAILIITGARDKWWDAADIANALYTLKYSRKRETEADLMGVDVTRQAGGNPGGLVTALKKILRLEQENGAGSLKILSTHPETKDRVSYLTKRCLELGLTPADLEVKFTDQPDRLGSVVSRSKEGPVVTVSTARDLSVKEAVWIKKPLWDEKSSSVMPGSVARGVAMTAGRKSQVSVTMEPGFEYIDIEQGDGVYPGAPEPEKEKTTTSGSETK